MTPLPTAPAAQAALALLLASAIASAEWPEFRGPTGQGTSTVESAPLVWSETENVAWKTPIPGLGWSSPVLLDGKIWLTAAADSGRSLRAVAVAPDDGRILHDVEVFRLESAPKIHQKNSHASPTPVLEPDRVYVHFGRSGTAALDGSGKVRWRNQEHTFNHVHGNGGSPVVWEDLLIFTADGGDKQSVVALDKNTGKTRWTQPRSGRMSFATPLAYEHEGRAQVLAPGGDSAVAYDPVSGEPLWSVRYDGFSVVPRPVYGDGLVYLVSGFYTPQVIAVRPDGRGDVTDSHVVWQYSRGAPLTPSPLLVDGETLHHQRPRRRLLPRRPIRRPHLAEAHRRRRFSLPRLRRRPHLLHQRGGNDRRLQRRARSRGARPQHRRRTHLRLPRLRGRRPVSAHRSGPLSHRSPVSSQQR